MELSSDKKHQSLGSVPDADTIERASEGLILTAEHVERLGEEIRAVVPEAQWLDTGDGLMLNVRLVDNHDGTFSAITGR